MLYCRRRIIGWTLYFARHGPKENHNKNSLHKKKKKIIIHNEANYRSFRKIQNLKKLSSLLLLFSRYRKKRKREEKKNVGTRTKIHLYPFYHLIPFRIP